MNHELSLGAKNITVYFFRKLVDRAMYKSSLSEYNKTINSTDNIKPIEFDRQLYDDAVSLPESKSVGLKRTNDSSLYKYGRFSGGNTYSDYSGTLLSSTSESSEGWVEIVPSTNKYFLYQSNGTSTIIACKDFTPEQVIEDFTPLYEALKNKDTCVNTSATIGAVNATFSESSSDQLQQTDDENTKDSETAKWESIVYTKENNELYNSVVNKKAAIHNSKFYYHSPGQIGVINNDDAHVKNTSVWNDVQAVIYDMKDESASLSSATNVLYCFQQPESISYSAQANYESQTTRGSQQPFQFYSGANAIELSFALNWHNDEVKSLSIDGKSLSLQEIADIAEDFTRPWARDNSIKPKLVKVILPGISEIGYMTQAQVTYKGDMTGDVSTGSGVINDSTQWNAGRGAIGNQHQFTTNYYYNQLEITFSLVVVKDTKLLPIDSSAHKKIDILSGYEYSSESEVPQETKLDDSDKASQQSNPATQSDEIQKSIQSSASEII